MESDVTHIHEHSVYTHCLNCKSWGINLPSETRCGNCSAEAGVLYVPQCCVRAAHAEGRKAAESYTAKMLKSATDEVRRCHEEIRQLEDKYARNFYRMPVSLDEESAKKVAQDLKELLEFVNRIMEFFKHYTYCPRCKSDIDHTDECELENAADSVLINFSRKCIDDFYVWKKVRGIE